MSRLASPTPELRRLLLDLREWIEDEGAMVPTYTQDLFANVATAVRGSAQLLKEVAPGNSVEVRVPPLVAVQCVSGPAHTRGTPPNVVQTDPHTWLRLVTGVVSWTGAVESHRCTASGSRVADIAWWLPLVPFPASGASALT